MNIIRRAFLALVLLAGAAPAFGQVPPPVPALPDTERRTTYSITASTCACAVGFQIYGDSTDYTNWLEVFVNGVRITQPGNWTISSPTGSLATIPRPITDAVLTFTAAQTGTIQIVGARRPRRTSQFQESQPVPTRNFNQVFSDLTAMLRENWDKTNDVTGRAVLAPPGETLALLPVLVSRANMGACFDSGGNLQPCVAAAGSFVAGVGIAFTGTNPTTISSTISAALTANVMVNGATGNCVSDDTAAFQTSINSAAAAGGSGVVTVPAVTTAGGCYRVGALNGTNKSGIIVQGNGDTSLIKVIGKDASNNWWDLSGSSHVTIRNIKIVDDGGTTIPNILFVWSCVGSTGSCLTSGNMAGLDLDHVTIAAKTTYGFLYAYGFGNTGGAAGNAKAGGGSLSLTNSIWTQSNNGPVSANPWSRNGLLHVDCLNSASITSAYVTIPPNGQATTCSGVTVINANLIDVPAAFIGTGTFDNNTGIVLYNVNAFTMISGSVQCLCDSLNVIWSDTQGATWTGTTFSASDGSANMPRYSVNIGGGINASIGFYDVFWPPSLGPPIAIDQGIGAALGGVWNLTVINNNIGTAISTPFVGKTANGCGSFTATNNWLIAANLQFLAGANAIETCGSIDANSILQQPGTITLPGSSIDNSTHIGGTSNGSWTPVDASGAGLIFTSVSANWTRHGNMVFSYGTLTYPATANGANAAFSGLPVPALGSGYGQQCSLSYTTIASAARVRASGSSVSVYASNGTNVTNATLSGGQVQFMCVYPAS